MSSFNYKYSPRKCDVKDKALLKSFRKKRKEWMKKLHGRDYHSIFQQLTILTWREAIYSTVVEAANIQHNGTNTNIGMNDAVFELIKEGFFRDQAIAIRRMAEVQAKNPRKAVVSLTSLIEDIEKNLELITREIFVSYDGLPYAYLPQKMKFMASHRNRIGSLATSGPSAWSTSEHLHKRFDKLSGIRTAKKRSRKDKIKPKWLRKLKNRIIGSRDILAIGVFVNKYIAHSADSKNRTQVRLTLGKILKCQRTIFETADCLSAQFLYGPSMSSPLPTPQYDHLENLDKPWVDAAGKAHLHNHWNHLSKRYDAWNYNLFSGRL